MSDRTVLAVDGGNSKTDLALVQVDGSLLAHVRGPLSSPHHLGLTESVGLLQRLLDEALVRRRERAHRADRRAGLPGGVDFPAEEESLRAALKAPDRGPRRRRNDTIALLRAGTERGWGVAVVCGAGINCVGIARRPAASLSGARLDHRRLGRRLRRRRRCAVRRGAGEDGRGAREPRAGRAAALRARLAATPRRGDARRPDLAPSADRAGAGRVRRGADDIEAAAIVERLAEGGRARARRAHATRSRTATGRGRPRRWPAPGGRRAAPGGHRRRPRRGG